MAHYRRSKNPLRAVKKFFKSLFEFGETGWFEEKAQPAREIKEGEFPPLPREQWESADIRLAEFYAAAAIPHGIVVRTKKEARACIEGTVW